MKPYDVYVFVLCAIVFVMFVGFFAYLLHLLLDMSDKLIRHGVEDENIKNEYQKKQDQKRVGVILDRVISAVICVIMLGSFAFSIYMSATEDKRPNGIPSLKVVMSGSMSYQNEKNEYLFENDLTDQLQTFDLVVLRHLPPEDELELYDIVMYEVDDQKLLHRIVGIEEPNAAHPNERHFLLQGDAVSAPDIYPVLYSQMSGIYGGERVPFVGSFVVFMRSPAGWLCLMLVLAGLVGAPVLEKKLWEKKLARLREIGYIE